MNRNSLTTAVVAGIAGVVGIANMANAVNLNPDGLGQVLLYPYYTTNAGQQTLISVVNTTNVGKAVKVRFLEGHNSREVLDFNLFMSPFDVWTANVFALSDAGVSGGGAGIFTNDNSCTAPALTESTTPGGLSYVGFRDYYYTGSNTDSGPTTLDRTQEGHFEMISMGDITGATLLADITHKNGVPPGCAKAETDFEASSFAAIVAPTSGLFGAASVVNVANGTYYAYNADAIDGFTAVPLGFTTGSLFPSLSNVNDAGGSTATSYVFNNGALLTSPYSLGAGQGIDAVSSIFAATNVYNEWQSAADGSVGSDWVVTFPTKRFYVDPLITSSTSAIAPFTEVFGGLACNNSGCAYTDPDNSCVGISATLFDREEGTYTAQGCTFSPCPPGQPGSAICKETNVISFLADGTAPDILGSSLRLNLKPFGSAGWANLAFTGAVPFRAANNGNVFQGLPVTGFEAVNFVNGNLGGVLANYSGVYRHRLARACTNGTGACS
ncbi:MAG TPA: hypothetical protein VLS52_02990 [Rudaea sp.]|nr:hypothetical protein [Rudaea sp.]